MNSLTTEPSNNIDSTKADTGSPARVGQIIRNEFNPPWWAKNPHVQTLWSTLIKRKPNVKYTRERFHLPDDDFVDVDWCNQHEHGPIILIIHGLEGSSESPYARGLAKLLTQYQCYAGIVHFRGCSGEHNKNLRAYHSGEIEDFGFVLDAMLERFPNRPIAAVGYSIGGSVLLNHLGRTKENSRLDYAVAASVPYLLSDCADRVATGLAKIYQWHLVGSLKRNAIARLARRTDHNIDMKQVSKCKTFWDFDDLITSRLHGFKDVHDYYNQCSSRQWLRHITTPTLLVHALDDPFMFKTTTPSQCELAESVVLSLNDHGGHVGFIEGTPFASKYWLENRIVNALSAKMNLVTL